MAQKRFRVALSFPGERRAYVRRVAMGLAKAIGKESVFYDKNFESELARPDLDTYLQRIYHDEADLIVVFLCAEYEKKEWCGLEWRAVRDLIKRKAAAAIMPMRFDKTHIHGLFSIDGYIDVTDRKSSEVVKLILERLESLVMAEATQESPPAVAGQISPALRIVGRGAKPAAHRRLLHELEQSMKHGELQDSHLAAIVYEQLLDESELPLSERFDPSLLITGIRLSDEYFVRVSHGAGHRDWQRDFPQTAVPILVGLCLSLKQTADAQATAIHLCDVIAGKLRLQLQWPADSDESNELKNAIYRACLNATEIESDDALLELRRLPVVGPT